MIGQPLRVAVVGSGPSGFYVAENLLNQDQTPATVDMFDWLPTPFGLIRAGVAPDHPNIKAITRAFDKTAHRRGFRFFGNVEIGNTITCAELAEWYDATVYCVGADRGRRNGVPGDGLTGNHSATDFVGWYNGHPRHADLSVDLSCERAVVIGNGNVALDVARMLAKRVDDLATTDMANHALEALAHSNIRDVFVLGRRGPLQAAFTNAELVELGELDDVDVVVDPLDLNVDDEPQDATTRRNLETLRSFARRPMSHATRRIVLRFNTATTRVHGQNRVESIDVARTQAVQDAGRILAQPTSETESLDAGLVVHAVGYAGTPLPTLPFDDTRCIIPNEFGRVTGVDGSYVAGWIKRGPTGVIGTNRLCAKETVEALLSDARSGLLSHNSTLTPDEVARIVAQRVGDVIDYQGWAAIDARECARGEGAGRPRVKFTRVRNMLDVVKAESA
ncbi:FAD-dependent oxidoreductase [Mycolicibacter sinensis]|uniref:ferredoxin--NADP(+) reductase n=1 Tax=Mycolicibacter sinensis (strain JDM601) TaxID=875328 RepID=A0A1A3U830_MYCSD|nr:hypothetical protein A5648_15420 [Mycolicibacter sinensis]